jgi:hypothetical protein
MNIHYLLNSRFGDSLNQSIFTVQNLCILNASAAFKHRCSVYIFYAALYSFPSAKNSITSAHYQAIGTENNPLQSHRIPYLNPQELLDLIGNYVSSSSA